MIFYVIVAAGRFDLGNLRQHGWLFDVGVGSHQAWYKFYSYLGGYSVIRYFDLTAKCSNLRLGNRCQLGQVWPALVDVANPICFVRRFVTMIITGAH